MGAAGRGQGVWQGGYQQGIQVNKGVVVNRCDSQVRKFIFNSPKRTEAWKSRNENMKNLKSFYYDLINVSILRKLAMMLHPDKTEVAGAQESFKLLGQARNYILKTFRDY